MPKTMKGKEFLKRIFMGKLVPLPPEITDSMAECTPPVSLLSALRSPLLAPTRNYKVIFAVANKLVG